MVKNGKFLFILIYIKRKIINLLNKRINFSSNYIILIIYFLFRNALLVLFIYSSFSFVYRIYLNENINISYNTFQEIENSSVYVRFVVKLSNVSPL